MAEVKERIIPIYIEDEMRESYIDYAMSVIVGRALPDVRDGLKPVHRRILYAMHGLGMSSKKPYRKAARVVGEVLGKYHPHGDVAVYDTITRMVQDFSQRYPLIDGQGNFGSVDGDAPAAMRYTEVRLAAAAEELLKDIEKETINFVPNFDGSLSEPTILPAVSPNLLVNGSSGIAVGMATNIPPHNMQEVVDAIITVIGNPEATSEGLMDKIKGPDFPTGALIFGKEGIRDAYTNGRGLITLRAKAEVEEVRGGREEIIISELPYQVNKARLVENIADLMRAKRVEGIAELRDESDRSGMRIVIEVRRGENARVILNQLYKHTQMQTTFGVIMLALVDNRPQVLNLKQMIYYYLEHRKEVVGRRTQFDLRRAASRAHILEGLKVALSNLDRVISLIKKSSSPGAAQKALMKVLPLTPEQAGAILDMRLQRLTALERDKILQEHEKLLREIVELKAILASPQKVLELIKEDLLALKARYGDRRRTMILEMTPEEFSPEDLIPEEDVVITISNAGYIKRIPVSTYRMQKRGGRGMIGMGTKEKDFVEHIFGASTHHYILCFTNKGKIHWLKVYQVPQASPHARGKAIINLLPLGQDESVTTLIPVREFDDSHFLVMVTKTGLIKRTPLREYSHPRSGGIIALNLDADDELIKVELTDGDKEILLATSRGLAIRFEEPQVRSMGRTARGVRGITLAEGDWVIGMGVIGEKKTALLVITANGYGKRTLLSKYRTQLRGGKGLINIKTTQRNGPAVGIRIVREADEIMAITSGGKVIRSPVEGIRCMGRNTQGVRLMRLSQGDRVMAVARVLGQGEA